MRELKEIPIEDLRRQLRIRRMVIRILDKALFAILAGIVLGLVILGITGPYEAIAETIGTEMAAEETDFAAEKQQDIGMGHDIAAETSPEVQAGAGSVEAVEGSTEADLMEYLGIFTLTAYCSCRQCCGRWSGGPTASGVMPAVGRTIAVDKRVIPLGTRVYIEGYGEFRAEDTGSAIVGNRIDVYVGSHAEAQDFADGAGSCRRNVWIVR